MSSYIDRDALGIGKADRNAFKIPEYADGWNSAVEIIANAPTADVEEVRHGEWGFDGIGWTCSECGEYALSIKTKLQVCSAFCPNCGAKMDGERREENAIT